MKTRLIQTAAAALLSVAIPALAAGEQPRLAAPAADNSEAQMQVDMTGKPPYKRRFVQDGSGSEQMLVIDDQSGTIGRIGPPSRPGRSTQSLRTVDPAGGETADFARFEEVGNNNPPAGNPARRYRGAPGKHQRIRVSDD